MRPINIPCLYIPVIDVYLGQLCMRTYTYSRLLPHNIDFTLFSSYWLYGRVIGDEQRRPRRCGVSYHDHVPHRYLSHHQIISLKKYQFIIRYIKDILDHTVYYAKEYYRCYSLSYYLNLIYKSSLLLFSYCE